MAVPDFQSFTLPLLELSSDKKEHSISESKEYLQKYFNLSEEDLKKSLPRGVQTVFENHVYQGLTFLRRAGLLETSGRGRFRITARGLEILSKKPEKITNRYLKDCFPESNIEEVNLNAESNSWERRNYPSQLIQKKANEIKVSKAFSSYIPWKKRLKSIQIDQPKSIQELKGVSNYAGFLEFCVGKINQNKLDSWQQVYAVGPFTGNNTKYTSIPFILKVNYKRPYRHLVQLSEALAGPYLESGIMPDIFLLRPKEIKILEKLDNVDWRKTKDISMELIQNA